MALVLAVSLGAHALGALVLAALPAQGLDLAQQLIAFDVPVAAIVVPPPPPRAAATPPPPVERPERPRRSTPMREARPAVASEVDSPVPEVAAPELPPQPEPAPAIANPTDAPPSADTLLTATEGGALGFATSPGGAGRSTPPRAVAATQTAPSGPSDADIRRLRRDYVRALESLLRAEVRYPRAAQRARHEGRVELALRIGRDGRLLGVRVERTSGFAELDAAALEAARSLSPPAPPSLVRWAASEEIRAPVVYVLR